MTSAFLLAALTIASPKDGAVVPTLKAGQKAYFAGDRAERFVRMDNVSERKKLLAMGSAQEPVRLEWRGPTNVVYLLSITREGGDEQLFAVSNRTFAYVTNLELGTRFDWGVRQAGTLSFAVARFTTEAAAPRFLRAGGVANFRDLGGWKVQGGGRVRENMVFRSAGLRANSRNRGGPFSRKVEPGRRRVTDDGIKTLRDDFGIKTEIELRMPQETSGMEGSSLGADVRWVNVPLVAYEWIDHVVRGREPFARAFALFTKRENYPIMIHCSGGRDRTGTLAFLLNGLLGVSEDDLCRDWEASVFGDADVKFSSQRIQRLLEYLNTFPGATLKDRIEAFAKGCGITDEDLSAFRSIMLQ